MELIIRNERENEYRTVEELTREAFWNLYVPGCSEHFYLHNVRDSGEFIPELDFVAELDGQVIGNIIYTRGKVVDAVQKTHEVICFGPVSVLPVYQKQGLGSALIWHSLDKAQSLGFNIVCIYGDPRYYHRFGFRCGERYDITNAEGKFAVALMVLELVPGALRRVSGGLMESDLFNMDDKAFQKYESTFPPREKAVTESQAEFKILSSLVY
jgi:predicted N-acetyltransferase YhbS